MALFHMIGDFLLLLMELVTQLWRDSHVVFLAACAVGLVLGALAWWLTNLVALNFNRQFSFHLQHHFHCGVAAIATLLFTLLFIAFRYTGDVGEHIVDKWKDVIQEDKEWSNNTFRQAYEAVYELRNAFGGQLENFATHPHPDSGQRTSIPTNYEASKWAAAQTYATGAVGYFRSHHPFLSKILWARSESAQQVIIKDMERVFKHRGDAYQAEDAIQLASEKIRQGLKEQVPRIVLISRIVLVIAFILVQAATLVLLIRAALADIKEQRSSPRFIGG